MRTISLCALPLHHREAWERLSGQKIQAIQEDVPRKTLAYLRFEHAIGAMEELQLPVTLAELCRMSRVSRKYPDRHPELLRRAVEVRRRLSGRSSTPEAMPPRPEKIVEGDR